MALIVQKYGGTSVANAERLRNVARRVAATRANGHQVVVVVSAMGETTDELAGLAKEMSEHPDPREMDLLLSTGEIISVTLVSMALHSLGVPAISLTGAQAGIQTESFFSRARILSVEPQRVLQELEEEKVVLVAGFQGITAEQEITTIGRGGSDTTAVALACALHAHECQIYTDVEGVFTADPRLVADARRLAEISYDEMLELASLGAKVMAPRAVELGAVYGMPILVTSSFAEAPGTLIHEVATGSMEVRNKVRGIAHDTDVAKITLVGVPDRPGIAAALFAPLAAAGVSVDTIVQNAGIPSGGLRASPSSRLRTSSKTTDLTFTVAKGDLTRAMALVEPVSREIGAQDCLSDAGLGKVSVVGTGIQTAPGYAARMFEALHEAGINIEMITTSEIRITCVIAEAKVPEAVRALHRAFELEKPEA